MDGEKPNGKNHPIFLLMDDFWGGKPTIFGDIHLVFWGERIDMFMFVVNQIPERSSKQSFKF